MEQSLFIQWVNKYFKPIVSKVVEKINGTKKEATYLSKTMLTKEYSPTLKWSSTEVNGSIVAADVVAMDSPLPLKLRDSISKADGDIPKIGMKLYLGEKQLTDLEIIRNQPGQESQLIQKLFADVPRVISGVWEKIEIMYLQALSSGVTLIPDSQNVGTGIRVDFGYKAANKFNPTKVWSDVTAPIIDDIERVRAAADANGDSLTTIMMDTFAFNNFKKNNQVKEFYASYSGIAVNTTSVLPTPTMSKVNEALADAYGITIKLVDRSVKVQKNGVNTTIKPWTEGAVVFLTTENVGRLVWGSLAEMTHQAKQVTYETADGFILVSKYHKIDPLQEFTSSQALALPVIDGVDSIYTLDSKVAQA